MHVLSKLFELEVLVAGAQEDILCIELYYCCLCSFTYIIMYTFG